MALYKSVYYYYYYYQLITETMRNILKVSVCLLCGEECEFGDREDWCSGISPHNCYSDAVVCCHTCPALQLPDAQPGKASAAQVRRPMYGTTYADNVPLPAIARRCCSNRSISPARRAHSSKLVAAACGGRIGQTDRQADRQTDRRTPDSCIDPASHTMLAEPAALAQRQRD